MNSFSNVARLFLVGVGLILVSHHGCAAPESKTPGYDAITAASQKTASERFQFLQQTPDCSDLDVILPGQHKPAFRLLLPEALIGADQRMIVGGLHTVPGMWKHRDTYSRGEMVSRDNRFKINVRIDPRGREMNISLDIVNLSDESLGEARADICMNFNHLPGKPDWSNSDVMPASIPLKRAIQADHWFEQITPKNMKALGKEGWVTMHPWPKHPKTDGGSYKCFKPSDTDEYRACAVRSLDGKRLYFMAWDAPCRFCTPCRENACMHLWPLLERPLGPGEQVGIRGIVGVYDGDWDNLAMHLRRFLRHWPLEECPATVEREGEWIELFNGRDLTGWLSMGPLSETTWHAAGKVEAVMDGEHGRLAATSGRGILVNGPVGNTFDLASEQMFTDCELHAEFMVAKGSNSGIFFNGRYEIQILDSFGKPEIKSDDCGGIYYRWVYEKNVGGRAPQVNASKPPGEWQEYDVIFRAPRFDNRGNKIANARFIKVVHNGIVIHENVEMTGPTRMVFRGPERPCAPLVLQGDHGPVAFRNIKVRRLNLD